MGIRLFNSKDALHEIFEEFELSDSEDDEGDHGGTAVVTSQLRHFVIQVDSLGSQSKHFTSYTPDLGIHNESIAVGPNRSLNHWFPEA